MATELFGLRAKLSKGNKSFMYVHIISNYGNN